MLSTEESPRKLESIVRTFFNRLEGCRARYNMADKAALPV